MLSNSGQFKHASPRATQEASPPALLREQHQSAPCSFQGQHLSQTLQCRQARRWLVTSSYIGSQRALALGCSSRMRPFAPYAGVKTVIGYHIACAYLDAGVMRCTILISAHPQGGPRHLLPPLSHHLPLFESTKSMSELIHMSKHLPAPCWCL